MAKLIDADALMEMVKGHGCDKCPGGALQCTFCTLNQFVAMIDSAPTIDAAPVRRGEWERYNLTALGTGIEWYRLRCSECKLMPVGDVRNWNFCPNCGADMRKEAHHEPED